MTFFICMMHCFYTVVLLISTWFFLRSSSNVVLKIYSFYDKKLNGLSCFPLLLLSAEVREECMCKHSTSRIIKEVMWSIRMSSSSLGLFGYVGNRAIWHTLLIDSYISWMRKEKQLYRSSPTGSLWWTCLVHAFKTQEGNRR